MPLAKPAETYRTTGVTGHPTATSRRPHAILSETPRVLFPEPVSVIPAAASEHREGQAAGMTEKRYGARGGTCEHRGLAHDRGCLESEYATNLLRKTCGLARNDKKRMTGKEREGWK